MPAKSARGKRAAARPADAGELADRLHSAAIHLLRRLRREDDASGLPAPQLSALSVIVFGGPITLGALAAAEQVRPPTISKLVATLEEAGLVEREIDEADRRVMRVRATSRGTRLLQEGERVASPHSPRRSRRSRRPIEPHSRAPCPCSKKSCAALDPDVASGGSVCRMTESTSYLEHACTLAVSGWDIPAALTLPAGANASPLASAILLVPGSLFSDVNGDYPSWNSFPHVYAHLARQLSARGHAVYRFAKLGPGTGSVPTDPVTSPSVRNWDGRRTIAAAALDQMHRELAARGVQVARTIAAGHSEGSVVVSRLAVSDRGDALDGVVLLAGPAVGILGIMREQTSTMVPPADLPDALARLDRVIDLVRRDAPIPDDLKGGTGMGAAAALGNMPDDARRYMRECDATDPVDTAGMIRQAVLVIQGGGDTSVPQRHGEALRDALVQRPHGAEKTDYLLVSELSHMFKLVPPSVTGAEAFGFPGETDVRVTDKIDAWVRTLN